MATTWEDVQMDMAYEAFFEQVEAEIKEQSLETTSIFISRGFESYEDVTSGQVEELRALDPEKFPQAASSIACSLLEVIERETICLPLMIAGLGFTDKESDRELQMKKLISSGINAQRFTVNHAVRYIDAAKMCERFGTQCSALVPDHDFFRPGKDLWKYRENILSYRNHIVHGRKLPTPREATYAISFIEEWRKEVLNSVLKPFDLILTDKWHLSDV